MSDKTLKGRIVQKHDTAENWAKAATFVPKAGELIIYDVDGEHEVPRFKVGDGVTVVGDLPFACASQSGGGDSVDVGVFRVTRTIQPGSWQANTDAATSAAYPYVWSETDEVYNANLEVAEVRLADP